VSPRERTHAPGFAIGADPSEGRSVGRMAKTIGLFALVALPVGILISSVKSRNQTESEKAAFRRVGLDWNKRFQYPK
jgi:hypothetical protein